MSFIMNESGKTYAPGYFLAHEEWAASMSKLVLSTPQITAAR